MVSSWSTPPSVATQELSVPYHAIAFGLLGFFLKNAFIPLCYEIRWKVVLILSFAVLLGGFDEIHQSYVPGRDASFQDWAIDSVAAFFGVMGPLVYIRISRRIFVKRTALFS